jgi:hypothetical protein
MRISYDQRGGGVLASADSDARLGPRVQPTAIANTPAEIEIEITAGRRTR